MAHATDGMTYREYADNIACAVSPCVHTGTCLRSWQVLVHNAHMRVLDLTKDSITPTIVMLDAHKHLGARCALTSSQCIPAQHVAMQRSTLAQQRVAMRLQGRTRACRR